MATDRPKWWRKNEELRVEMNLPQYEPARLADGTYVHEIIERLEDKHDCEIQVVSDEPSYPSRWTIRVNGQDCTQVRRRRDENRNNVYSITSEEFRQSIEEAI